VTTPDSDSGLRGRRAVQAEETRKEILGSARRQFATKGYAATSLKEIAAEAGVSIQTVYDSVGSKSDLVRRLNDLIDSESGISEIARTLQVETDPVALCRIPARVTRSVLASSADIIRSVLDGSRADLDLADVAREGGRRHRAGSRAVVDRLAILGHLDPRVSIEEATITVSALADYRLGLILIDDHGLSLNQVEDWIAAATVRNVLLHDSAAR
jgi:AcrR family transcriptional regulator